jgi:DNA-binding SARP family transcriptional activator
MTTYQQVGRLPDAVEAFERCRRVWEGRLNREPSAETLRLYEQITQVPT